MNFEDRFKQIFSDEEIKQMKEYVEQYKNNGHEPFGLSDYYYMTIIRKVVMLSEHAD